MSDRTLNLPGDPSAIAEAAAAIAEHADGEQARKLARRWAGTVAPDRAEQVAAAVIADLGPAEPELAARPGTRGAEGRFTPDPRLAELRQRNGEEEPFDATFVPRWEPNSGALIGEVLTAAALDLRTSNGRDRLFLLRDEDGRQVELWATWKELRDALFNLEAEQGRAIGHGDLLAVRPCGKHQVGKHQQHTFAVTVVWAD